MYHKQFLSKHRKNREKHFSTDILHTCIPFCLDKSSAFSIGVIILSTVKNAAKLAVYDEIIIRVKNHQIPATILVDTALNKINNYVYNNIWFINILQLLFCKTKTMQTFTHMSEVVSKLVG